MGTGQVNHSKTAQRTILTVQEDFSCITLEHSISDPLKRRVRVEGIRAILRKATPVLTATVIAGENLYLLSIVNFICFPKKEIGKRQQENNFKKRLKIYPCNNKKQLNNKEKQYKGLRDKRLEQRAQEVLNYALTVPDKTEDQDRQPTEPSAPTLKETGKETSPSSFPSCPITNA